MAALAVSDDGLWSGRCWSNSKLRAGSTDNTAALHAERKVRLQHPKFVKSVLPNPHSLPYILTGSDDEHIRVWDGNAGEETLSTPLSVVMGHCGEVTAMAPWIWERDGTKERAVVTASLDGTLRRWTITGEHDQVTLANAAELLHPPKLDYDVKPTESMMTEEEERELAELMSDDD